MAQSKGQMIRTLIMAVWLFIIMVAVVIDNTQLLLLAAPTGAILIVAGSITCGRYIRREDLLARMYKQHQQCLEGDDLGIYGVSYHDHYRFRGLIRNDAPPVKLSCGCFYSSSIVFSHSCGRDVVPTRDFPQIKQALANASRASHPAASPRKAEAAPSAAERVMNTAKLGKYSWRCNICGKTGSSYKWVALHDCPKRASKASPKRQILADTNGKLLCKTCGHYGHAAWFHSHVCEDYRRTDKPPRPSPAIFMISRGDMRALAIERHHETEGSTGSIEETEIAVEYAFENATKVSEYSWRCDICGKTGSSDRWVARHYCWLLSPRAPERKREALITSIERGCGDTPGFTVVVEHGSDTPVRSDTVKGIDIDDRM